MLLLSLTLFLLILHYAHLYCFERKVIGQFGHLSSSSFLFFLSFWWAISKEYGLDWRGRSENTTGLPSGEMFLEALNTKEKQLVLTCWTRRTGSLVSGLPCKPSHITSSPCSMKWLKTPKVFFVSCNARRKEKSLETLCIHASLGPEIRGNRCHDVITVTNLGCCMPGMAKLHRSGGQLIPGQGSSHPP